MDKREKVINGLECCMKDDCDNCPYYDPEVDHDCDYFGKCLRGNMYRDALALLKAQETVKPVPAIDDVGDWLCGNCYQSVVGEEELDASGFVPVKFNFCPNCGRAVKWE